jgi:hypothetical protein
MDCTDIKEPPVRAAWLLAENLHQQHNSIAAKPLSVSPFTIDVSREVAEIERALRVGEDLIQCVEGLAILERWQFDEMLDDASRMRARLLVQEFAGGGLPLLARR